MSPEIPLVHVAGVPLAHSCHACAFFHSKEEAYRVLLPFVMEGFEHGDYVAPAQMLAEIEARKPERDGARACSWAGTQDGRGG